MNSKAGKIKENLVLKKCPTAPDDLDSDAKKYWYELGQMLVKERHLMTIDIPTLKFCCEFYSLAIHAEDANDKKKYAQAYVALISKFGATPKNRIKESKKVSDDMEEDDDWIEDL